MLYDPLLPKTRFSFTIALENKQMDKAFSKKKYDCVGDLSSCFNRQNHCKIMSPTFLGDLKQI